MCKKKLFLPFICIFLSLIIGCATVGREFNYHNRKQLNLESTTVEEAIKLFGEPYESKEMSNKDGNFKELVYSFAKADAIGGASARQLSLEFRENILNGYLYISGFSVDATDFNYDSIKNIEVGTSNKENVLNIIGEPSGKILCPSYSYSTRCEKGNEIWFYAFVYQSQEQKKKNTKTKMLILIFDENGVVTDLEASKDI